MAGITLVICMISVLTQHKMNTLLNKILNVSLGMSLPGPFLSLIEKEVVITSLSGLKKVV